MLRELYRLRVAANPGREALRFSDHTMTHGDLLPRIDRWQEQVEAAATRCDCSDPDLIWAIHGGDTIDNLLLGLSQLFSGRALLLLPLHATEAERQDNSRLSCQITSSAALDGLVLIVPDPDA